MAEAAGASDLCASTVLYAEQPLERACAEIAASGIGHVDLWHVKGWCEHLAGGALAVGEVIRRHGLRLEAVSAYSASDSELSDLLPVVAGLGGRVLITGSDGPDVPVERFAARIAPLARQAAGLGITLGIENHWRSTVDSIASMVELAERLPGDGVGIALAPIHLHARGASTADALRRLRGRVAFMYIWDWGPTGDADWKDPQEQFVGTGRIDFAPVFRALREVRYTRPLCVFAHGPERWPAERTTEALRAAVRRVRELEAAV